MGFGAKGAEGDPKPQMFNLVNGSSLGEQRPKLAFKIPLEMLQTLPYWGR
jgi:hypothetical protein